MQETSWYTTLPSSPTRTSAPGVLHDAAYAGLTPDDRIPVLSGKCRCRNNAKAPRRLSGGLFARPFGPPPQSRESPHLPMLMPIASAQRMSCELSGTRRTLPASSASGTRRARARGSRRCCTISRAESPDARRIACSVMIQSRDILRSTGVACG